MLARREKSCLQKRGGARNVDSTLFTFISFLALQCCLVSTVELIAVLLDQLVRRALELS
jgi:hypothetical protein